MAKTPHVVILGAGFGGLGAAQQLQDAPVRISIIDKHDYHTFQPLLYQVATDELEPTAVAHPIRDLLHRHKNIAFHQCEVRNIDLDQRRIEADGMPPIEFDYLVMALGSIVNYHGTPGAEEHSFPLYTMNDAIRLHDHILKTLEAVDKNPALIDDGSLTFCIIGGGPTGTELAGALSELFHTELSADYPNLPIDQVRIILFEHSDHLLGPFKPKLREYAQRELEKRGVEVRTGTGVEKVAPTEVTLASGEVVKAHTLVWAAGVEASPLAKSLGVDLAPGGRIPVGPDLQTKDCPGVFVVGDMASTIDGESGKPLPGLAAVAQQAGRHAGKTVRRLVAGQSAEPFNYFDKGVMAQVGRGAAVVELPKHGTLTGHAAWLAWLGVHLTLLSGAEEKTSVFVDWGWNLLTNKRGKRILLSDEDVAEADGNS